MRRAISSLLGLSAPGGLDRRTDPLLMLALPAQAGLLLWLALTAEAGGTLRAACAALALLGAGLGLWCGWRAAGPRWAGPGLAQALLALLLGQLALATQAVPWMLNAVLVLGLLPGLRRPLLVLQGGVMLGLAPWLAQAATGRPLAPGVSVTDACISMAQTVPVLESLAAAVKARRAQMRPT